MLALALFQRHVKDEVERLLSMPFPPKENWEKARQLDSDWVTASVALRELHGWSIEHSDPQGRGYGR